MSCPLILHLAIPAINLDESIDFYLKLGAKLGRKSPSWAIFNFCNMQLVLHESHNFDMEPTMYPRHFGVIVKRRHQLISCHDHAIKRGLKFFEGRFTRFEGQPSEHVTFFLCDPSNNTIEFKWYRNAESIFN